MDNKKSRIIGIIAAVLFFAFIGYLLSTEGLLGLVKWEKTYRMYLVILVSLGVLSLLLALVKKGKALAIISTAVSIALVLVAVGGSAFVYSLGTWELDEAIDLNFYTSSDEALSKDGDISVAVASDGHWGAETSNPEMRNKILDTINNGPWDLFIFGGDMVELGYVKSQTEAAIKDLEEHLDVVPAHFVKGNHDVLVNTESNYLRFFQPGETSTNHVLEVTPGVHWVIFDLIWDMSDVSEADLDWLEETLSSFDQDDTVIVQSHGFYYGSGNVSEGGGDWFDIPDVIEEITPIFEKYNVDLVVSGHQHSMELMEMNGIHYALVGPMGGSLYADSQFKTVADQLYYNGHNYGFTTVDIKDGKINLAFRNEKGEVLYKTAW